MDLAPQIGIRETRRIIGEYRLTEDDVLGCADFPDTIGVNGWPVEAHVAGSVEFRWPRGEDPRGFNQLPCARSGRARPSAADRGRLPGRPSAGG